MLRRWHFLTVLLYLKEIVTIFWSYLALFFFRRRVVFGDNGDIQAAAGVRGGEVVYQF